MVHSDCFDLLSRPFTRIPNQALNDMFTKLLSEGCCSKPH